MNPEGLNLSPRNAGKPEVSGFSNCTILLSDILASVVIARAR